MTNNIENKISIYFKTIIIRLPTYTFLMSYELFYSEIDN